MENLKQHIESLIFTAEESLAIPEIQSCLKTVYDWDISKDEVETCINELKEKYNDESYSFHIVEIAGGICFFSKPDYHASIQALLQIKNKKKLSNAALETLAIIAYKQPITKAEMEHIRGVSCDYSVQKLLEKELIIIKGKSNAPGRPIIYGTSEQFMDHFGLKSPDDLPQLKDLQVTENEIGTPSD
ncbi:MAG: SMC-Scp complex subunit ScpB [Bacteroidia bacterium]|nr:SMC-Scp complex subunit ScpB [Bacteroidia bacterium]NNC85871.1 SMC-Scp complex subunit ScpB [Bacteroidia bacterium]NNM16810.1 SMC-Scp complex subunit ScpB [Bacteroidia bacterium]